MSAHELIGQTIAGKYQIKRLIGAGGMGSVFEGEHVEIGKRVAIKVIDPSHASSSEVAARFRREARAASRVESENIVQVFDVGQDPASGLYMVMEYLTGQDLADRIRADGRLDVALAAKLGVQAARALGKAHAAGVVHRDLKPANLFLTTREDGAVQLKILDFGISKLSRDDAPPSGPVKPGTKGALTREGVVIGTPQYMSPEQAQGLPVDLRTDVWSLGAVLYEALSGQNAYEDKGTYQQTLILIVTTPPKPLSQVAPWVPAEIAAVIHEALTHDLDRRLPDCTTFARRLEAASAITGETFRTSSPSGDDPASRHSRASTPQVIIHAASSGSMSGATKEVMSSTVQGPVPAATATGPFPPKTTSGVAMGLPRTPPVKPALLAAGALLLAVVGFFLMRAVVGGKPGDTAAAPAVQGVAVSTAAAIPLPAPISSPSSSPSPTPSTPPAAPIPTPPPVVASHSHPAPKPTTKPATPGASPPGQYGAAGVATSF